MNASIVNKASVTNTLHRQIKWLTEAELTDLAEQFDFENMPLNGGWTFCHHIVHQGYLKPFVNFCKNKFDAKVKKRQNPPKNKIRDIVKKTVDSGSNKCLDNEKLDIFTRSLDWQSYAEFQKQKAIKHRDLTDDEKYDILVKRYEEGYLQSRILDSVRWRSFWLSAVDAAHEEDDEEYGNWWGYGL